ncbi:MAG: hypothetical protein HUU20_18685 [Pirellulales bacterium]|nr:hypothetical protein [Pirellulales bacterium]
MSTGVLGGSRGTGGVIDILLPSGGAVINVSDLANKVIKAGPQIVTEVWDAITNTPIFNGTTTLGGILNTASIGMTTIGEWHVGMRFGETAMLWFRIRAPKVEITEVKGLYTGAGAYQAGYKSGDNLGRIYSNAAYDAADSTKVTWAKNRQFVDIKVSIPGGSLPDSARIVWEVIDPDDPSNESSGMNDAAKRILDLNDYDGVDNDADGTPDNSDGNDNTGSLDGNPAWEELSTPANDYALSGNETKIKNGISGVRLNVTDHGGDNFVVRARIKVRATDTPGNGDQTGEMTVWKKINVDYAKMPTATPLPTAAIVAEFTKAFVQFDVVPRTATTDRATLGSNEDAAWPELLSFVQRAGEFSKEGPGWFFLCAARLYAPIDASGNEKIYPPSGDYGDATVDLNTVITLPTPMSAGKIPDWVTIVNPTTNQWTGFKATIASTDPQIIAVARDDYFNPTSTTPFLLAGLNDYGLSGTIPVRVTTAGGRNIAGMAPFPYHAGTTVIFTEWRTADILATSVHELAHGGNWDYKSGSSEKSCVMNYEEAFILTDGPTRTPIPWTSNRVGLSLCAEHIKAIRQRQLETITTLAW